MTEIGGDNHVAVTVAMGRIVGVVAMAVVPVSWLRGGRARFRGWAGWAGRRRGRRTGFSQPLPPSARASGASASSGGRALERSAAQPYPSAERTPLEAERSHPRRAVGAGAAGCAMDGPRLLLLLLLLGVSLGGAKEACPTGLYTHSGECCKACNLGEGVAQPCGANQTVCEPCLDSVTFSDVVSATEPCKPCTECVGLQSMSAPCVEADDAVCRCAYGYYQDETTGRCEACRVCEAGSGLVFSCQDRQNTVCEECPDGTYSDEANHVDPCLPCTVCEDTERQLRECTRWADAECEEIPGRWITRSTPSEDSDSTVPSTEKPELPPDQEIIASTMADVVTTVMGSSQPVVTRGTADNLIPVYCSILAAVVVGLVAYIAFKRWNSCKQNKQGANSRPVNQTPPPEGEKLHSDSGISVDSQSLHDQQPHTQTAAGQALKGDGGLYSSLPPAKREEVEKLLNGSAGDTWRHLAGELGYQPEHIDSFTHEACPARALLASWAAQDSATLDALLAALRRIQRADIVESLCSESTATSPV
ncbi:tumor necrosis factor receptor superfamily member 16 [Vulpes vulpes]|uniref:Tumor necrosis factor receptor superfamily member 16 n=1 Tax=Vulpes vulpes TaxID=9627 RepID=A0A3Q7S818_VULVU